MVKKQVGIYVLKMCIDDSEKVKLHLDSTDVCLTQANWASIFERKTYKDDWNNARKRLKDLTIEGNIILQELMEVDGVENVTIDEREVRIILQDCRWFLIEEEVFDILERCLEATILTAPVKPI